MCGISGFVGRPKQDPHDILRALSDAQVHRGPDADGYWLSCDRSVGFAHRRLSIIDLSPAGKQPMWSHSRRYCTTFNGEIYNFLDLRCELAKLGCKFQSTSDTEVMLAAFEQWGVMGALPRLNGMFATAVWDQNEGQVYLFRDRLGLKPLYYQWQNGTLLFSSELSLAFAGLCNGRISRNALALFLRHGYVPTPYSIYEGVCKLAPGSLLTVSLRDSSDPSAFISKYWDAQHHINDLLSSRDDAASEDDTCERLDTILRRSVRDRMIADVPLGAFLSGGIDSSLIVSYMQQVSNSQVRTFTIGFEENGFNESCFARKVAEHLNTCHTELMVTERDALDVVPILPRIYGEPFADASQIPTYLVSKLTRQHVTVALSGDGGDELFAGYSMYQRILNYMRTVRSLPKPLVALASKLLRSPAAPRLFEMFSRDQDISRLISGMRAFSREIESDFSYDRWGPMTLSERLVDGAAPGASIRPFQGCQSNVVEQSMCNDLLTYLPDDILVKVDRASMAVSLEVRAPFVDDFEIFDLAWKTPFALKMNATGGKVILRKLLSRFVPPALTDRPKAGFAIPLTKWLGGALRDWVDDCVSPVRLQNEGYLRPKEVARVHRNALQGDEYYAHVLWYICQFQSWLAYSAETAPSHSQLCYQIQ